MMAAQRQGHVDVCPPLRVKLGGIFPFKQKLDVDLNVQSDNPQQIGEECITNTGDLDSYFRYVWN